MFTLTGFHGDVDIGTCLCSHGLAGLGVDSCTCGGSVVKINKQTNKQQPINQLTNQQRHKQANKQTKIEESF